MDRFVSNYHVAARRQRARFDSGSLPRGARARRFRGLYCYPASTGDRCRRERAAGRDRAPDRAVPALFERARRILAALYGTSETLKLDSEGRVSLPDGLKEHAASPMRPFVGLGHKFQIWEPERFRAHLAEATAKVRTLKKRSGIPGCGAGSPRSTGMTAGRGTGPPEAAGGLARHIPVLLR